MENLSKNQLSEINAGGCKEIYSSLWQGIARFAGGDDEAIKAAGLMANQQFEYLETAFNNFKGYFTSMISYFK